MTLLEFGQLRGIEMLIDSGADVSVEFTNGVKMPRLNGIWSYERDGKSSFSRDPEFAVVGAESLGRGRAIFNGAGSSNEVFNSDWVEYEVDEPGFEKFRNIRKGGE